MLKILFLCLVVVAFSGNASEQSLVEKFIRAVNASNKDHIMSLVHPDCPKAKVKRGVAARFTKKSIPKNYELKFETISKGHKVFEHFRFFVTPEKMFQIWISKPDGSKHSIFNEAIARKGKDWYIVWCSEFKR